jgi:hypothetical protein
MLVFQETFWIAWCEACDWEEECTSEALADLAADQHEADHA